MFARLVSVQVDVDKLDEGIKIWNEKDISVMKSVKGYSGAYLLSNRDTAEVISITLWDNLENAVADEKSPLHQEQIDMYEGIIKYNGMNVDLV